MKQKTEIIYRQQATIGKVAGCNGRDYNVNVTVELCKEDWGVELYIAGVHGAFTNGNAYGGCGQITSTIREMIDTQVSNTHAAIEEAEGYHIPRQEWKDGSLYTSPAFYNHILTNMVTPLEELETFLSIWETWNLNGMNPGTPAQKAIIAEYYMPTVGGNHYIDACAVLADHDMLVDESAGNYKYGSAWLREYLPPTVINWVVNFSQKYADTLGGTWGESPINRLNN